jgi:hypothetical protein
MHKLLYVELNVFFQGPELSCAEYAVAVVNLLNFKGKFALCLDRSHWKFGKNHLNYLVLSWRISKDLSLPLFFVDLDKAGNSSTQERLDLLAKFEQSFGVDRIESLMADREFVGIKWFETLNQKGIPIFIRIKVNTLTPYGKEDMHVGSYFGHLKLGETRLVEKEMFGKTVCFAGTRSKENDLVIVMSNQDLKAPDILKHYKNRWSIEELFRKLKSSGFHWENTHMTDPSRLESLLIILGLATLIAYLAGAKCKIPFKKTLGYPLKSHFRQGLIELRHHFAQSLSDTIQWIIELLDNAWAACFTKNDG